MSEIIEIVLAVDDNYAVHCATTMASVLKNTNSKIRYHIFDGNISEKNKNKIFKFQEFYNCEICFYRTDNLDLKGLPLNRNWISVATYYRLFITDILPESIKKAIYLDCDVIVEQDIKQLWDYDITKYLAGVVEDDNSIPHAERLELSESHVYFNAGVLLLNIEKLRDFNFKQKALEYFSKNIHRIKMQDQDILNGILDGKCLLLPKKYNADTTIFGNFYKSINNITYSEKQRIKENPCIIHYTGSNKPWLSYCVHPMAKRYYVYLNYTFFEKEKISARFKNFIHIFYHKLHYGKIKKYKIFGISFDVNNKFSPLQHLFSVTNSNDKKHKIIYVLGIKIKINRNIASHKKNRKKYIKFYKNNIDMFNKYKNNNLDITSFPKAKGLIREIQSANFYILTCIDKICKENKIEYWIDFGTLLGAIRHQGFIPWDDDIDISMTRENYEKIIDIINNNTIDSNIYAEYHRYPENSPHNIGRWFHIKVRHRMSTKLFVDIFPYDYLGEVLNNEKQVLLSQMVRYCKLFIRKNYNPEMSSSEIKADHDMWRKYILRAPKCLNEVSDLIWGFDYEHTWKNWIYSHDTIFPLKKIKFENRNFMCVNKPKKFLYKVYGDYMSYPENINSMHTMHTQISEDEMKSIHEIALKSDLMEKF